MRSHGVSSIYFFTNEFFASRSRSQSHIWINLLLIFQSTFYRLALCRVCIFIHNMRWDQIKWSWSLFSVDVDQHEIICLIHICWFFGVFFLFFSQFRCLGWELWKSSKENHVTWTPIPKDERVFAKNLTWSVKTIKYIENNEEYFSEFIKMKRFEEKQKWLQMYFVRKNVKLFDLNNNRFVIRVTIQIQ